MGAGRSGCYDAACSAWYLLGPCGLGIAEGCAAEGVGEGQQVSVYGYQRRGRYRQTCRGDRHPVVTPSRVRGPPGAESPELMTIAAPFHRAPAPSAGAGGADEYQRAVVTGAFADASGE